MPESNAVTNEILAGLKISGETESGDKVAVRVDDNGNAFVNVAGVEINDVIIEAPATNEKYEVFTGTINTGTSNSSIGIGGLTSAYDIEIINKTASTTLKAKLNGTGNDEILVNNNSNEYGKQLAGILFTSLYLTNDSGTNIDYEITIAGV
jgi:hypothetical protein